MNINSLAKQCGFDACGVASPKTLPYQEKFQQWLNDEKHGDMHYLTNHLDKRFNPSQLVEETRSIISVIKNYSKEINDNTISRHAQNGDYHALMKRSLKQFATALDQQLGPLTYRIFCDTAPVLEKTLAQHAGLGWVGKNTLLINRELGSFMYLGEIFLNIELPSNTPAQDLCGQCEKCLKSCPTQAFTTPYELDARRCISYLTIEHQGEIDPELQPLIGTHIYGCDICQEVCPYNKTKSAPPATVEQLQEYLSWDEKTFLEKFKNSDIKRLGFKRWQRNLKIALKNR